VSFLAGRAAALESQLRAGGLNARTDVAGLVNSLPGVLIPPPLIEDVSLGGAPLVTWRLIALAANPLGSLASFEELAELLDALVDLVPVERAEPIAYALPALGTDPLPAYAVTLSGS
jgi:hypothetical protein